MKPLKILYACGPIDAASVYDYWLKGEIDPYHFTIPFVYQFYDLCRALNAQAHVIARCPRPASIQVAQLTIEHHPALFQDRGALLYYLGQIWTGLRLIWTAIAQRPDVLVIQSGRVFPFFLSPIAWLGIKVIPSYHITLWRKYRPKSWTRQLILALSRHLFQKDCAAILSTSPDITDQIQELTRGRHRPIIQFLSIYQPQQFAGIAPPVHNRECFTVLYVGRMHENKGIFDLLAIAQRFARAGLTQIHFDLCGTGSALNALQQQATAAGVSDRFACHGHCRRPQLMAMYAQTQVVIVPTTTHFTEGLNQVVIEGVLAGRPVITSAVCPAVHYVQAAAVEVPPDDVQAYGDAILQLYHDREYYDLKHQASQQLRDRFFDRSEGWGAKFRGILVEQGLV
ncbi:MAG: glycosyltransferase family 4 protein [Cyanobacteria bacterium P01_G01_bin.54]